MVSKKIYRIIIGLALIFTSMNSFYSQNIIGIWQAKSKEITSAYFETYLFFENGKFIYNTNQYDGLRRILSIEGKYEFLNGKLYITPTKTKEIEGGTLQKSELLTMNNSWELIDGKIIEKVIKEEKCILLVEFMGNDVMMIDKEKFYLIFKNPEEF